MNDAGIPLMDVVFVGGGHAHVHVIKMIGMNPISNVRFTLITKDVETPYSGMLPGYVAGYYTSEESHIDLGKLCSFGKFRLVHAEVTHIDTAEKKLHFKDTRPPMSYNILSINIGIVPRPLDPSCFVPSNQGDKNAMIGDSEAGNITPVKPIDKFSLRWEAILNRVLQQKFTRRFTIAIVGGGAGGVELCFAVHHRLKTHLASQGVDPALLRVILLNRGEEIMSSHCRYYISLLCFLS
jgi:selenide,water dikinase